MNLCWNRYILRIAKVAMDRCLMRLWRILYVNCRKNVCNGYFFFGNIIFWCSLLWRLPNRNCVCVYVWMRCSFSPSTAAAPHQISFNWIKLNLFCLAWISVIWECRRESEKYHKKMTTHAFAGELRNIWSWQSAIYSWQSHCAASVLPSLTGRWWNATWTVYTHQQRDQFQNVAFDLVTSSESTVFIASKCKQISIELNSDVRTYDEMKPHTAHTQA